MTTKECIICKNEFNTNKLRYKCCSNECSKLYREKYQKSYRIKYQQTDKFKQSLKRYQQSNRCKQLQKINHGSQKYKNHQILFNQTKKRKHEQLLFQKSNKNKQTKKEYRKTDNYKLSRQHYNQSLLGKLAIIRKSLKRKERLSNCIHSFSMKEWQIKCENCHGICPSCNKPFDNHLYKLSMDHILALYWANIYFQQTGKKFIYTIDKVQPLCLRCNLTKNKKLVEEAKPSELMITC